MTGVQGLVQLPSVEEGSSGGLARLVARRPASNAKTVIMPLIVMKEKCGMDTTHKFKYPIVFHTFTIHNKKKPKGLLQLY